MKNIITIVPMQLTDGSCGYDVSLKAALEIHPVRFAACTEKDAIAFADALAALIDKHTVDTAEVAS